MAFKDKETYNAYMKDYMLKRYHKRMSMATESLGGLCEVCGKGPTEITLNLHHKDPKLKSFNIAKLWSVNEKLFWSEVEKCELLCEPCHINHHRSTAPCGTTRRYWAGCRCDPCTKANSEHCKQYRQDRKALKQFKDV